jgi:hypothetical protein
MLEEAARGIRWAKLLTLTLPPVITVPEEWVTFGAHWRNELSGRTVDVAPDSPQAYRYMAERFNAFQTASRRAWRYSYLRVVEQGSRRPYTDARGAQQVGTGRVHYHLLVMCSRVMPQRTLSELATSAGLGSVTHIKALRLPNLDATPRSGRSRRRDEQVAKLAGYLAAYASKDGGALVPRRMRFFVMSREWARGYRNALEEARKARARERAERGVSVQYVRDADIAALLSTSAGIVDLRAEPS